ncbi:MAG: TIGR04283 family arsenosugar biosynthesis glycosyltransferase [Planctomycetaceae bacterium]
MSTSMLTLSVIVPVLNECAVIGRAIEACRQAGCCEIIVVDGGSVDGTWEAAALADIRLKSPAGRAMQQNFGAAKASGDVLLFLHADSILPADASKQIVAAMQDSSVIGGCFQQTIDAPGWCYRWIAWGNGLRVRLLGWAYGDQGIFIKRTLFEEVGGFPELPILEDLYLMKRLKGRGRFVLVEARLGVSARRWQRDGILRRTLKNWSLLLRAHLGWPLTQLAKEYRNVR